MSKKLREGEPRTAQRSTFSMPTLAGHHNLVDLVHAYGGEDLVCKDFRIAPQLLRSYLAGVMEPPFSLLLAIYWQGPHGFQQAYAETHWTHVATFARAKAAEARVDQYRALMTTVRPMVGDGWRVLLQTHGLIDIGDPLAGQGDGAAGPMSTQHEPAALTSSLSL